MNIDNQGENRMNLAERFMRIQGARERVARGGKP
jgi:hypothetical protein